MRRQLAGGGAYHRLDPSQIGSSVDSTIRPVRAMLFLVLKILGQRYFTAVGPRRLVASRGVMLCDAALYQVNEKPLNGHANVEAPLLA